MKKLQLAFLLIQTLLRYSFGFTFGIGQLGELIGRHSFSLLIGVLGDKLMVVPMLLKMLTMFALGKD